MKTHNNFDGQYEFVGKAKTYSLIAIVIGLVAILGGFALGYTERTFANLLLMAYYFAAVCMCGIFFCAVQYAAQAGWSASMIRIPQAFGKVLPIAAITLIVVVIAGFSLTHTITNEEGINLFGGLPVAGRANHPGPGSRERSCPGSCEGYYRDSGERHYEGRGEGACKAS